MLQISTVHKLEEVENILRRVAQRHGVAVHAVAHIGHVLRDRGVRPTADALVFTLCRPDLYAPLLEADMRCSAFLPAHIAAWTEGGSAVLGALPPRAVCALLGRPDLDALAAPLERLLAEIMDEAARPQAAVGHHGQAAAGVLGATEANISTRATIPQRIDCRGTKIEELAGTGRHDAAGG